MANPGHVLLVDDEPSARRLLREYLAEAGVTSMAEATDCTEARAAMATQAPALILLDIHMPGSSGLEFVHELRARGDKTCVVIVSVDTASATVLSALKARADGFIRKDAGREAFLEQLAAVMG